MLTLGAGKNWKELHENGSIRGNSFFASADNRPLINSGIADYTPVNLILLFFTTIQLVQFFPIDIFKWCVKIFSV